MAHSDYLKSRISQLASLISGLTEAGTDIPGVPVRFVDEAGAAYGVKHIENRPRVSTVWFGYEAARGNIPGATILRFLGYNPSVNNTREDLWEVGGTYAFPIAAGIRMRIISTSAEDDASNGGTGVRTVEVHYLDAAYAEQTETLSLNGLTAVYTSATNILRVQHVHTLTVGSAGAAVGTIALQGIAGVITYASITPGRNNSLQAIWTVPAGKTLYLTGWQVGVGHQTGNRFAQFTLEATTSFEEVLLAGIFNTKDIIHVQDGSLEVTFFLPLKVPARADVKISVVSDNVAANALCAGHFSGWYE